MVGTAYLEASVGSLEGDLVILTVSSNREIAGWRKRSLK